MLLHQMLVIRRFILLYNSVDLSITECSTLCCLMQVLVVDNHHSQLVTCGTIFQGTCQSRDLANISRIKVDVVTAHNYQFVASRLPTHAVVAIVAPGPSNSVRLYVGTDDQPSRNLYDARGYTCGVTRRYLNTPKIFQILPPTVDELASFARLSEEAATSPDFLVQYVSGFSVENFTYFLTTQPAVYPAVSATQRVSKLSQVCHDDELFDSYVEMRINCRSSQKDYNLVRAATVLRPGTRLAGSMNLPANEHLLVAVFYGAPDSAVCVYRLSDIRRKFTENIASCYGSSSLLVGRQFHNGNRKCTPDDQVGKTASNLS